MASNLIAKASNTLKDNIHLNTLHASSLEVEARGHLSDYNRMFELSPSLGYHSEKRCISIV